MRDNRRDGRPWLFDHEGGGILVLRSLRGGLAADAAESGGVVPGIGTVQTDVVLDDAAWPRGLSQGSVFCLRKLEGLADEFDTALRPGEEDQCVRVGALDFSSSGGNARCRTCRLSNSAS